ncbi:MAG: endonuclease domain-containing protein [Methylobacteriaceae bacterium]|nr:endonuclease domain-containing protein [Methylobacteriaceae bacterium]
MPHALVSREQRDRAKELRQSMTRAETLLWRYLKAGRLGGLSFRRQAPVGKYIADFVCHTAWLIVEVDGETHDFEERVRHDQVRDAWLVSRGFAVMRFMNEEVLQNLEGVSAAIGGMARTRGALAPLHDPPPQGGRERQRPRLEESR